VEIEAKPLKDGAVATAVSLGAFGCSRAEKGAGPLVVSGPPVTCNPTLPLACSLKAASNREAAPGAPRFEYEYSKYGGWPEIKESLMAGRIERSLASRGAAANDLNVLVCTGGRLGSEAEFRERYRTSGFRLTRTVLAATGICVTEGECSP
jgi:hypothetical protein